MAANSRRLPEIEGVATISCSVINPMGWISFINGIQKLDVTAEPGRVSHEGKNRRAVENYRERQFCLDTRKYGR
jgi:hypothetical protein